jgi:hypothetical protein
VTKDYDPFDLSSVNDEDGWVPPGVNTSVPHSARMYDWWLGGKDNYASDRELGKAFLQAIPSLKTMAKANRAFLRRTVDHLVREAGIRQFLDIGTGIPTEGNVHEIAQAVAPESRVVYVDNDPIVLVHARALMPSSSEGTTAYIDADVRCPERILNHPALARTLDLNQPVALTLIAILMLLEDDEDPWHVTRTLMDALPSGSYLVISHPGWDFDPQAMAAVETAARRAGIVLATRTRQDVERFFGDWRMVEPGVVPVTEWRPSGEPTSSTDPAYYWGGMARKD